MAGTFIIHIKGGYACEIGQIERENSLRQVRILTRDIRNLIDTHKPFVLFSGGKDSMATLLHIMDLAGANSHRITAIYVDTTVSLPGSKEHVEDVCENLGVNLQCVRPKEDFFNLAKKWGIPGINCRWCCRELKIKPIRDFFSKVEGKKVVFDGIRAAESSAREKYIPVWYHPTFRCLSVSPIFRWSNSRVLSYVMNNPVLASRQSLDFNSSTECWCGAYKTESDYRTLYRVNNEVFSRLADLEEGNGGGYTFIYHGGSKKTLRQVESEILNGGCEAPII